MKIASCLCGEPMKANGGKGWATLSCLKHCGIKYQKRWSVWGGTSYPASSYKAEKTKLIAKWNELRGVST